MRYAHLSPQVGQSAVNLLQKAEARENLGRLLGGSLNLIPEMVMREVVQKV